MKRVLAPMLLVLGLLLLCAGCLGGGRDNGPYDPGTPPPAAHTGLFTSDHGSLRFDGDGERVELSFDRELAELTGLPEGEQTGTYVFLSGDLPPHGSYPIRYDVAHELQITVGDQSAVITMGLVAADGKTGQVGVNVVTPERIPMLFREEEGLILVEFRKQKEGGQ